MNRIHTPITIAAFLAAAVFATGCDVAKSGNPLSPAVAGPIPGVAITAPKILEPATGLQVPADQQPVTLLIENGSSNGSRPLTYVFEMATDANFTNKVLTREGVAPADNGRTSLRLQDALASGRTYFWRARAEDGANASAYSETTYFNIFTPTVIDQPTLVSPGPNAILSNLRPQFVINNAPRSGPVSNVGYTLELALNPEFTNKVAVWTFGEAPNQTRFDAPGDLQYLTVYYWHVRAFDASTTGPWSFPAAFMTEAAPAPPPPPPSSGGGSGPVGDWRSCGSTPGVAIVQCVHSAVRPARTAEGAFEVTKRVAWLLRGHGVGLLLKPGGENIVSWKGRTYAAARVCYPDGHIYKILSDVPATNGPSWQDNDFVDRSLYVPAIDPGS